MMANKKPRISPSDPETVKLTTNVYDIKATKAIKVYRYAMTLTQYVPKGDGEREIQLTRSVHGE